MRLAVDFEQLSLTLRHQFHVYLVERAELPSAHEDMLKIFRKLLFAELGKKFTAKKFS
jgi:hypothetical protein